MKPQTWMVPTDFHSGLEEDWELKWEVLRVLRVKLGTGEVATTGMLQSLVLSGGGATLASGVSEFTWNKKAAIRFQMYGWMDAVDFYLHCHDFSIRIYKRNGDFFPSPKSLELICTTESEVLTCLSRQEKWKEKCKRRKEAS